MSERVKVTAKKAETKKEDAASKVRKPDFSQP